MTIDEAIRHYEKVAENQIACADRIDELHCDSTTTRYMAEHHRQLAEWLRELKYIKTMTSVYEKIRKGNMKDGVIDVIDDHDILFNYFKQVKEVFEGSDSE